MSVVAKLYVAHVERDAGTPDTVKVRLGAVTRGEENKTWAEATPSASFEMTIQNPAAAVEFVLGKEFYVTFDSTGAEPATLADGHEYVMSDYERDAIAKGGPNYYNRCQACGGRKESHEEPLRSQFAEWRP